MFTDSKTLKQSIGDTEMNVVLSNWQKNILDRSETMLCSIRYNKNSKLTYPDNWHSVDILDNKKNLLCSCGYKLLSETEDDDDIVCMFRLTVHTKTEYYNIWYFKNNTHICDLGFEELWTSQIVKDQTHNFSKIIIKDLCVTE